MALLDGFYVTQVWLEALRALGAALGGGSLSHRLSHSRSHSLSHRAGRAPAIKSPSSPLLRVLDDGDRAARAATESPSSLGTRASGDAHERDRAVHIFMEAVEEASAVTQPEDSREAAVAAIAASGVFHTSLMTHLLHLDRQLVDGMV